MTVHRRLSSPAKIPEDGVGLIADISGFTPLTEALTHGLSPDQGAEELTCALDGVFTPLIEKIHAQKQAEANCLGLLLG